MMAEWLLQEGSASHPDTFYQENRLFPHNIQQTSSNVSGPELSHGHSQLKGSYEYLAGHTAA